MSMVYLSFFAFFELSLLFGPTETEYFWTSQNLNIFCHFADLLGHIFFGFFKRSQNLNIFGSFKTEYFSEFIFGTH